MIKREELRLACVPGDDCPVERAFYDAFVKDARCTFSSCLAWLSEPDFEKTIHDLAVVELQRQRLSALIARDGLVRPKRHPVSGIEYGLEETLAAGRYATALENRFSTLMERLLVTPIGDDVDQPAQALTQY